MKKVALGILLLLPFVNNAQEHRQEQKEKIESEKIAFITKELDLTPDEAQKFWPVYNQFAKEKEDLRKQRREMLKEAKADGGEMTDAELQKAMENRLSTKQKELDLEKQYHTRFLGVLPVKKVANLYRAEEKFKRVLLARIRENKGKGGKVHRAGGHR